MDEIYIPECDFSQSSYKLMIDNRKYFRVSSVGSGPVHLILGGLMAEEVEPWKHLAMGVDERDWMIKIATFVNEEAATLFIEQSQVMIKPIKDLKANNDKLRHLLLQRDRREKSKPFSKTELMSMLLYGIVIFAIGTYLFRFFFER